MAQQCSLRQSKDSPRLLKWPSFILYIHHRAALKIPWQVKERLRFESGKYEVLQQEEAAKRHGYF